MKKILTIAGSDCSGGAGIQADIKTITVHKMYAMSVITALTAQNTTGVFDIEEASPTLVGQQLDAIFNDIVPDAIKIGMVSNSKIIEVIVEKLIQYNAKNIVVDPVMVATSGSKLIFDDALDILSNKLFKLATLITPNILEAQILANINIVNSDDMLKAAKIIYHKYHCNVLIKGGHSILDATDLLYENNKAIWIQGKRIANSNTHGTGCTLSSAITCQIAAGNNLEESVIKAKDYISKCLKANLDLGKGSGPLNHMCDI
ncbi:MAG: bifunctional hydroxymethylpyrimidine kinase/phosphomethylpyrimidine kinase [Bacilli bacterium]|jgi:hydroxymethylpyrimidine/phosphomethylpyrimidine kinase|nr:bifunctional hydroxymethylpyrimidine kinase/phosphomethylpyrimidine kinase [Bacilli bacterium]